MGALPQFCFLGLRHPHADRACPAISPRSSVAIAFISPRNSVVEAVRSAFVVPTGPDGAYDSFSLFGFNPGGFKVSGPR